MLSVLYAECHIQALYGECRYAECRGAKYSIGQGKRTVTNTLAYRQCEDKTFCSIGTWLQLPLEPGINRAPVTNRCTRLEVANT
jgi:hypothetical protein